jgi:hypothetical protein
MDWIGRIGSGVGGTDWFGEGLCQDGLVRRGFVSGRIGSERVWVRTDWFGEGLCQDGLGGKVGDGLGPPREYQINSHEYR